MTSPDEQDAHTRHVGTAWRHQSDGIAGAVEAARPARAQQAAGVRRRLAGAQQQPWRSGARRLDSASWSGAEGGDCPEILDVKKEKGIASEPAIPS